jgi:methylated-DNA-[protein]-cysteine S-methyltransferase
VNRIILEEQPARVPTGGDEEELNDLLREGRRRVEHVLRHLRRPRAAVGVVRTALGRLLIVDGPRGIVAIHFLDISDAGWRLAALRRNFDLVEQTTAVEEIRREIGRFLGGDHSALKRPVDLSAVESPFKRRALQKLRHLPPGSVISYQALAAAVGAPNGQRAIGSTMASNPVPIYVPCHRVVKSDGAIGYYGGGVECKVRLLRAEGFHIGRELRLTPPAVVGYRPTHTFCRPQCAWIQQADHSKMLIFADSNSAQRAGMRPCSSCRPG